MKEDGLITVIEYKHSFMDQRLLVASLFIWSAYSKCPSLLCPRNSKRCHVMGESERAWFQYTPRHTASACTWHYWKGTSFIHIVSQIYTQTKRARIDFVVPHNKNLMVMLIGRSEAHPEAHNSRLFRAVIKFPTTIERKRVNH